MFSSLIHEITRLLLANPLTFFYGLKHLSLGIIKDFSAL